jgi:hypothetical protein
VVDRFLEGFSALERQVRDVGSRTQTVAAAVGVAPASPASGGARPGRLPVGGSLQRQQFVQMREMQLMSFRSQMQSASSVLNSMQATAYGDKGNLLSTNNLLLAGNQLLWSMLDPVLHKAGIVNAPTAMILAAIAPVATLFTGEVLLSERQHVRFLSGVTAVPFPGTAREFLRVGTDLSASFRERTDVPVTVSAIDPIGVSHTLTGRVVQSVLEIELALTGGAVIPLALLSVGGAPQVRVAWTVDTGANVG